MILLDKVYKEFDNIARKYDVIKSNTVGDAYIVVIIRFSSTIFLPTFCYV